MNTRIRLVKIAAQMQLGIPKPPPPSSPATPSAPAGMDYALNMKHLLKTYGLSAVRNPSKIIKGLTEAPADISAYVDQPPPPPAPPQTPQ